MGLSSCYFEGPCEGQHGVPPAPWSKTKLPETTLGPDLEEVSHKRQG